MQVSFNADVLLYYFGWVLRIPRIGGWALRLPFMPRLAAFLSKWLPKRPVRGCIKQWSIQSFWLAALLSASASGD